jgi:hypothetical protein
MTVPIGESIVATHQETTHCRFPIRLMIGHNPVSNRQYRVSEQVDQL